MVNLNEMTTEELEQLISEAVTELRKRVQAEQKALDRRKKHIADVLAAGSDIEKPVARPDPRIGRKIEPKYQLGTTLWTGRGWMPDDIEKYCNGDKGKLKDLLIKK